MLSITQAIAEDKQDQRRKFSRSQSDEEANNTPESEEETSTQAKTNTHGDDLVNASFSIQSIIRLLEDTLYQRLDSIDTPKQSSPWLTNPVINDNATRNSRARHAINAYSKTAKNTIKTRRLHAPTKTEHTPKELYQALLYLRSLKKNGEKTLELNTSNQDLMAEIIAKTN